MASAKHIVRRAKAARSAHASQSLSTRAARSAIPGWDRMNAHSRGHALAHTALNAIHLGEAGFQLFDMARMIRDIHRGV